MNKTTDKRGSVRVYSNKFKDGRMSEHRFIIEKKLGIKLSKNIVIHHIDGDPSNNNIRNLEIMTPAEHSILHIKKKFPNFYNGQWSENFKKCIICEKTDTKHTSKGVCHRCYDREYKKKLRIREGRIPYGTFWGYSRILKRGFHKCSTCGTKDSPMARRGICRICYEKQRVRVYSK